jgi:hypothetical protein
MNITESFEGAFNRFKSRPVLLCLNVLVDQELLLCRVFIGRILGNLMRILAHDSGPLSASVLILMSGRRGLTLEPIVLFHFHACSLCGGGRNTVGLGDHPSGVGLLLNILQSKFFRL